MTSHWTGGQYSLFRGLLGLGFFSHHWPRARGVLEEILAGRAGEDAWTILGLESLGIALAISLGLGLRDRLAGSLLLAVFLVTTKSESPILQGDPGFLFLLFLLITHLHQPAHPFGSMDAVGRADPAGDWKVRRATRIGIWIVLCSHQMLGGLPLLMSLVSHDSGFLSIVSGLGRVQMAFGLVFPVLALIPAARFEAWVIAIALIAARALLGDGPIVHPFTFEWPGVVLLYVFAFDPGWIRPRGGDAPELIFYDGHCALCHRSVRFVLAEDQREVFQFAPLQSHVFEKAFPESVREPLPDSVVVLTHDGSPRTLSSATIHILLRLGGAWGVVGRLLWLIPRPARDMGYRLIAAIRFEVFGRRDDVCPVIPERLRERFTWD